MKIIRKKKIFGKGITHTMLIFTLLEFCIHISPVLLLTIQEMIKLHDIPTQSTLLRGSCKYSMEISIMFVQ